MEWITVLSLIVVGLGLIVVEVLFVPGTTVVGVFGFLAAVFGLYLGFVYFGSETGWWLVGVSAILFSITLYYSFKGDTWNKFSLKETIASKVNEGIVVGLKVGDEGFAVSVLKPFGKAEFADKVYEVKSLGSYIDSGTKLKIIRINTHNIFVEPIN